jgi:DNA-binding response OmpR family regulator
VLLDLGLPDANGIPSLERVLARAVNVPVVVMTELANDKLAEKAIEAGAQDYLVNRRGHLLPGTGSDGRFFFEFRPCPV